MDDLTIRNNPGLLFSAPLFEAGKCLTFLGGENYIAVPENGTDTKNEFFENLSLFLLTNVPPSTHFVGEGKNISVTTGMGATTSFIKMLIGKRSQPAHKFFRACSHLGEYITSSFADKEKIENPISVERIRSVVSCAGKKARLADKLTTTASSLNIIVLPGEAHADAFSGTVYINGNEYTMIIPAAITPQSTKNDVCNILSAELAVCLSDIALKAKHDNWLEISNDIRKAWCASEIHDIVPPIGICCKPSAPGGAVHLQRIRCTYEAIAFFLMDVDKNKANTHMLEEINTFLL